jgi:S1-C subfamily serine protease
LKIEASGLTPAQFGDSEHARVGEWVVAIGSPYGLDYTVTAGVLSGVGRAGLGASEIEDYLQTDASINPGNSGGPLVDLDGNVLGVNTMIIGRGTGIGFAVPASIARQVARQLVETGAVRRAWIGVGFQELTPELASQLGTGAQNGAVIASVVDAGPAARAGLRAGDVVVAVAGERVEGGRDLLRAVLAREIGTPIQLTVARDGRERSMSVTTGERPGQDGRQATGGHDAVGGNRGAVARPEQAVGLRLRPTRTGQGAVVAGVQRGSPAARAGFQASDVIIRADRRPVREPQDVAAAFHDDGEALLEVRRGNGGFFAVLSVR